MKQQSTLSVSFRWSIINTNSLKFSVLTRYYFTNINERLKNKQFSNPIQVKANDRQ